jgi:HEAT repeat protein
MTFDEIRLLIPQYLSNQLEPAERAMFEEQLAASVQLREEVEELRTIWEALGLLAGEQPSAAMRARFYQRLNALQREDSPRVRAKLTRWNANVLTQLLGAAAVFVLGIYVGRAAPFGGVTPGVSAAEVAQLKTQVQGLHETVALSLLQRQSATSRLEGISWGSRVDRPDEELLSALVSTLNQDPNTNVRLAALDALEKFSTDVTVRKALVNSLTVQDSPLVQIALIDSLVHVHDDAATGQLRKLTRDDHVNVSVRQRAQWGIQKLTYQ